MNGTRDNRPGANVWQGWIRRLGSLRLTVVCLAAASVLVFWGTLAQVKIGIYRAQEEFFRSFLVFWTVPGTSFRLPIFPGGYLIGSVLLLNLLAAYTRYPRLRRRLGLILIHGGIAIILVGQAITDAFRLDGSVQLVEGQTKAYAESDREFELALVDRTAPDHDRVYAIPESWLRTRSWIRDPRLPFQIQVLQFWPNSIPRFHSTNAPGRTPEVTRGLGRQVQIEPAPKVQDPNRRNIPSAIIALWTWKGDCLGRWLVSGWLERPQQWEWQGRRYALSLRLRRYPLPFAIQLLDFRYETYPGTDIPKWFSSRVRLLDPSHQVDREALIYMNHPLRYRGWTLYQAGYDPQNDRLTILEAVRNPVWISPYVACAVLGLGMLLQFGGTAWQRCRAHPKNRLGRWKGRLLKRENIGSKA